MADEMAEAADREQPIARLPLVRRAGRSLERGVRRLMLPLRNRFEGRVQTTVDSSTVAEAVRNVACRLESLEAGLEESQRVQAEMLATVKSLVGGLTGTECLRSKKLFFMHVPKAGGQSVSEWLKALYRPSEVCPRSIAGEWRTSISEATAYRLFAGHFNVDFVEAVDPSGIKLTVIREPIQRVVSLYDFWRSFDPEWADLEFAGAPFNGPRCARSMSFSAFIRTEDPYVLGEISNVATRQLLGCRFEMLREDTLTAIQQATSNLLSFNWFTTTNRLSIAIEGLARNLRVPPPEQRQLNQTYEPEPGSPRSRVHRTYPTRDDVRHLAVLNILDTALYRAADLHLRTRWCGIPIGPDEGGKTAGAEGGSNLTIESRD